MYFVKGDPGAGKTTLLREATALLGPARTTALSAALLWHAARGECVDELAGLAAALTSQRCGAEQAGRAVSRLLSVGHTSGAALALGLVAAAETALHAETAGPVIVLAGQVRAKPLASFKRKNLVTSLGEMASFGE